MKAIRLLRVASALLAGVAAAATAHANPRMGGVVIAPPPPPRPVYVPPPTVYVPRPAIDTRSVAPSTGPGSAVSVNSPSSGGSSSWGPSSPPPSTPKQNVPRSEGQQLTMTGPDGKPMKGPDGKVVKVNVTKNNVDITPEMKQNVLADESRKYPSGNYQPVDPKSQPTRAQDCAGNNLQQVFGGPPVVVGADRYVKEVIKPSGAKEITNNDGGRELEWDKTKKGDTGVMWHGDSPDGKKGEVGHIFTVDDPATGKIITKDGHERVMTGNFTNGDDLHRAYENGRVVIYRIDPNIKLKNNTQVANNTKTGKK